MMTFNVQAHPFALGCFFVALLSLCAIRTIENHGIKKLPPGPKGIPFLGNLFQLSKTPWKEFEIWKKQYGKSTRTILAFASVFIFNSGPLVYITVAGQGILVLNSHQVATDLLDRRGHIYSGRPRMISNCSQSSCHIIPNGACQWQARYFVVDSSWFLPGTANCG